MTQNNSFDISVIIPTINRQDNLLNTIADLEKQVDVSFEIIIIDQTIDSPVQVISELKKKSNVNYINSKTPSASAARNLGINSSKSEILLFIDDDVIINDKQFIFKHYRHYIDTNTIGVVGRSFEIFDESISYKRNSRSYNKAVGFFYFPKNYGCTTFVLGGRSNNLSIRKNIAISVGGMDENYEKGAHREEGDFCLRISRRYSNFIFDPQANLVHIGNRKGGIRSWNDSDYIKAKHNMVGAIYFNLNMATLRYKHEYIFATLRYLVLNKTILIRPKLYTKVIKRVINSYISAYKLYKSGPKYINLD